MTLSRCEDFLKDPAAHDRHPEECEACRALVDELARIDGRIASDTVEPLSAIGSGFADSLPVAPWEGASYRSWAVAVVVAAFIAIVASLAFWSLGISPLRGFAHVISSETGTGLGLIEIARAAGDVVQNAPARFHVVIGVGFVVVNLLFAWLLRRAPRGADVTPR